MASSQDAHKVQVCHWRGAAAASSCPAAACGTAAPCATASPRGTAASVRDDRESVELLPEPPDKRGHVVYLNERIRNRRTASLWTAERQYFMFQEGGLAAVAEF